MNTEQIDLLIEETETYVIQVRRGFHQHPEESWKEFCTSKKILEELNNMGIEAELLGEVGVQGWIRGSKAGKTVCLRADIDALSIEEKTGLEFSSLNKGVMHACGHDAHIAVLLGAAKVLVQSKEAIQGTVKLLFQPAEEATESGAVKVIEHGVLDGVDGIFGLHYMSGVPSGKISVGSGPIMGSCDDFDIFVKGRGGHGASPHEGIDAVVASASILMNLQTIVSRQIDPKEPVVISVGTIQSGDRFNIIASDAMMTGTCRCFSEALRKEVPRLIQRVLENTAKAFGAEASLDYKLGLSALINHESCNSVAWAAAAKAVGEENVEKTVPLLGSEDFSEYTKRIPGFYVFIGNGSEKEEENYPIHHEKYAVHENVLKNGTAYLIHAALEFLNQ